MKMTGNGKYQSGSALNKVLPRLALYHKDTTMMEIKKDILEKVKYIFGDEKNWEMAEKELNETITLHLVDNLP